MQGFLFQASIYLAAAVIAVPIAARLGLGSVLGYLAAGMIIGPALGLVGSETADLQHFAEFGVVMMLFIIGLELSPRMLWDMRHKLIGLGGLQISITAAVMTAASLMYGLPLALSVAIGLTLSLSSTAIVLQTLTEKGLMKTSGGRSVFSVLLAQDIAVIPILAMLPLLAVSLPAEFIATMQLESGHGAHYESMSLVKGLPNWALALVTISAIASIVVAGIFIARPIFHFIDAAHLRELHTAFALLIVVGISFLMTLVDLSPALGAFLAGVVLANSEFRHQLESAITPFKGLLLGLFFITVGAGINFELLAQDWMQLIGLAALLIVLKTAVLYGLSRAFAMPKADRGLFTLGLAQAGEFGFVLIAFAVSQRLMPNAIAESLLLVIALTMLITPLLFLLTEWFSKKRSPQNAQQNADPIDDQGPVIIAGIGRFGQIVNRLIQASGFKTVVLDNNIATINLMRRFGFKSFLGDPTEPNILHSAGIDDASILVVALDNPDAATRLVKEARHLRGDSLTIIARARDRMHVYALYQAGADKIIREMFDSSLRAGRYALETLGLSEYEAAEAERLFFNHDRAAIKELAGLWKEDLTPSENTAYVARAKELEKELEALLSNIDDVGDR